MYKIINKNRNRPYDVPVIHDDGRLDSVQVMGPKRPVFLRSSLKPAPAAFSNKDLHITEVSEETSAADAEVIISQDPSSLDVAPAASAAGKSSSKGK